MGNALASTSLSWEYVQTNKDLARRILVYLEDRRVLYLNDREDYEACRKSAQDIRNFLTLEIMNVQGGGHLEELLKRIRSAARAFVTAAGQESTNFSDNHGHFVACLSAFRDAVGAELNWLSMDYQLPLQPHLQAIVPPRDPRPGM
ncbi:hypothetical protein [Salinibacterium sp. ZJ450]|uniref:hypothetical protein n=1 Tax=Salinibacterium sp. ZJ450 TaxID=2708338 RepID=UPI00351D3EBD